MQQLNKSMQVIKARFIYCKATSQFIACKEVTAYFACYRWL